MTYKKKLIEVALPLDAINLASVREKSMRHGHPSSLHLWWARRPLAAARAILFAQLVDDPSSHPDIFPTVKLQEKERLRLFKIIEEIVKWENTTDDRIMQLARDEIMKSWRYTCAENADHSDAEQLFDSLKLPNFHDPFSGGGAIPLEAQRLGLESYASDLNPVAVVINKAMIEIPTRFTGRPPINPNVQRNEDLAGKNWTNAQGLAEDVRYYGRWIFDEARKRIGHLYPEILVTPKMVLDRSDLAPHVGTSLVVISWLWTRTVKSPNPAFAHVDVPLATTFLLGGKAGKESYVEPVIDGDTYSFLVKMGNPSNLHKVKSGTKLARGSFHCLLSGTPISYKYIDDEANAGRMGNRLLAVVAEGVRGRVWLSPTDDIELIARTNKVFFKSDLPTWGTGGSNAIGRRYGFHVFGDYFTPRQAVALTTFSDLVKEVRSVVERDALTSDLPNDGKKLNLGGAGVTAYTESIAVYLAMLVDQMANHCASVCGWNSANTQMRSVFARQVIPMTWDFAESNPFGNSSGSFNNLFERQVKAFDSLGRGPQGHAVSDDAATQSISYLKIISTDPPYYDNIGYADLSDFFYVWMRRSIKDIFPELFLTVATPKSTELVALPYRHGGKEQAGAYFLDGMTQAMHRLAEQAHPAFPVTIYYAFKQSETEVDGTSSSGWDTFLGAVIQAGFEICGTWPIHTEKEGRVVSFEKSALASSIVLVCRRRTEDAKAATRREFVSSLKSELPKALANLQAGNIAPVDLAQAAIGPGMAIYTRYAKVLDAEGKPLTVRAALALINQTLDEVLAEQEGEFDADTRWALTWFDQVGFADGDYGVAEQLSKSKNTAVTGLVDSGILLSKSGKVRLLKPSELLLDWDPTSDKRLTVWEMVHQLIRVLEANGEGAASILVSKLGSKAETARELCYRLYTQCERRKRAVEAMSYNGLVQSWPEITRLANEEPSTVKVGTTDMFE